MHRILVLRGGALGDFIVTLPTLAALRARWPQAQIELVGNATAAQLALNRGLLNAAHSQHESRWAALYSSEPLPAEFAAWLGSFDLVLNYWPDADGDLRSRFPLHSRQTFLSASAHPTLAPAARHYAEPLRALGIVLARENSWCRIYPNVGQAASCAAHSSPRLALHPGSGSATKNWPLPRWIMLCQWLRESLHLELLIVTGESETPSTRASLTAFGQLLDQPPLEDLVTALSSCGGFIGHDSGISHLAAACALPSLLLFGPSDAAIWAPPAPHVRVLRQGASLAEISLEDVQLAVTSLLRRS